MSANFTWYPVKNQNDLEITNGKSSFQEAMERAFGQAPWTLRKEHLGILSGLFAGTQEKAFDFISDKIMEFGEIRVDYSW